MKNQSKMPQIGEAIFCIIYLSFAFFIGIIVLLKYAKVSASGSGYYGTDLLIIAALTLVLAGGDSFHLVPRIINAFKDNFEKYEFWAGLGLMVSSITMTVFYIILNLIFDIRFAGMYDYDYYFYETPFLNLLSYIAYLRIILCLFPQNNWFYKEGNMKWSIIRNVPFIFVGVLSVIYSFKAEFIGIGIAIIISFACYLPVVFGAKKNPKLGMLMIPKTIAYMYIIGYFFSRVMGGF